MKTAVVYFSVSNVTGRIAKIIAEKLGADIFEIEPKVSYTDDDLNWRDMGCRANREQNDVSARPEIANEINLDGYDKVYLGYPIWWNTLPKIINTFVETHALDGKEIVAFCTSGSSSIDTSISALKEYGLNIANNKRLEANVSEEDIKNWLGA